MTGAPHIQIQLFYSLMAGFFMYLLEGMCEVNCDLSQMQQV